jgi:hypothetical protein
MLQNSVEVVFEIKLTSGMFPGVESSIEKEFHIVKNETQTYS